MNRGLSIGVIALILICGTAAVMRWAEPKGPELPSDGYDVDRITVEHEDIDVARQSLNMGDFDRFLAVMNQAERTDKENVGKSRVITIDFPSGLTRTFNFREKNGHTFLHETGNVLYPKLSRYYGIRNRSITGLTMFDPDGERQ